MTVVSNRFAYSPTDSVHIDFALNLDGDDASLMLPDTGLEFTSVFPLTNLLGGGRNLAGGTYLPPPHTNQQQASVTADASSHDRAAAARHAHGALQGEDEADEQARAAGVRQVRQLPYVCRTSEDLRWVAQQFSAESASTESGRGEAALLDRSSTDGMEGGGRRRRVHLMLFTERAAWGVLNVTVHGGRPLVAWSFGPQLMPSLINGKQVRPSLINGKQVRPSMLVSSSCCPYDW
jgi:hypothetical protein